MKQISKFNAPLQDVQDGLQLLKEKREKESRKQPKWENGAKCRIEQEVQMFISKTLKSIGMKWTQRFAERDRIKFRVDVVKIPNEYLDAIFSEFEPYEWFDGMSWKKVRGFETMFYLTIYTNK